MAKNDSVKKTPQEQFSQLSTHFETLRESALLKLASREEGHFEPGSLNWWSGKIKAIISHASEIEDNFLRGRYALKTFSDDDSTQAIGNSIKKTARKNLEEIIKISASMYYQFCIDLDEIKTKGKR
ncbi:hypothetical protein B1J93_17725 [Leptospira kirschneri serovar Pomona]|uniref:Uncharacterized protein n=1 Tax=Leptospira kirschneri serovar Pomona TaxID=561005 RepID=A0A1T1DH60_9LEPT|nr:hypothetical protein [Leptospira kirschneri]OOV40188.1 hypothetical protein B1J93_17725 [Leptospira kirschneri serovar Pomona]